MFPAFFLGVYCLLANFIDTIYKVNHQINAISDGKTCTQIYLDFR